MSRLPEPLRELPSLDDAEQAELVELASRLGYEFARPAILRVALTLVSWVNEHADAGWPSNANLEFFGDAVLDLVATDAVWSRFPDEGEGVLTRLRSHLVAEPSLLRVAKAIGLGDRLYLGKGDRQQGPRDRTLAEGVEALIGAVYLDARAHGSDPLVAVERVFDVLLGPRLAAMTPESGLDPKSRLQVLIQARHKVSPVYVQVGDPPPPGEPHWRARVEVTANGSTSVLGEGEGRSLRAAERAAAEQGLRKLGVDLGG